MEALLDDIHKQFGKESALTLRGSKKVNIDKVSTGSLKIDYISGGGLPFGRIVEIFGPESSGKTTLTLHVLAESMKKYPKKLAAFIDAEHSLDPNYAEALGVDIDRLFVIQPDSGEQGLEIAEALIRSGDISCVVVDSVDALTPLTTMEGEMGDRHVAPLARLMSQATRKLASVTKRQNTLLLFVNQVREKVGQMYGNPETTVGGRALKFYSTIRLEIRRNGKPGDDYVKARVKCVKNKVAPPFKETFIDIAYGKGIMLHGEILDMAVEYGIIDKAASWYKKDGKNLVQGRAAAIDLLHEDQELMDELYKKVQEAINE